AGFKSESRPASNRNTRPECVGIRKLHEFAQYAPDHDEVSVAGIGEGYQQLYDAFWHSKTAADESGIWLNRIAEYLEPITKDQPLRTDDLPRVGSGRRLGSRTGDRRKISHEPGTVNGAQPRGAARAGPHSALSPSGLYIPIVQPAALIIR